MGSRACVAAVALLGVAACDPAPRSASEIQVVGRAAIEKPAEIFRITGDIVGRDDDRAAALRDASDSLDRLSESIGGLDGLARFRLSSTAARATVVRPYGCEVDGYSDEERPEDCGPVEAAAILSFMIEGAPAEAAGSVIAFLVDAEVENAALAGFDVADRAAAELEVKQAALANALSTAQALAAQADVEVGRPSTIQYGDQRLLGRVIATADEFENTLSRLPQFTPSVDLDLLPSPVRFEADVAVSFTILEDDARP